jgi:hypothetical protein
MGLVTETSKLPSKSRVLLLGNSSDLLQLMKRKIAIEKTIQNKFLSIEKKV